MYTIEKKKRVNSRTYTPFMQYYNIDEVVAYVKEKELVASKPYMFTHIKLSDGTIIRQEVMGLTCSPMKLAELLEAKQSY